MSSTLRSNSRDLHKNDYYVTPVEKILQFLYEFEKHEHIFKMSGVKVLAPCAGGDADNEMSYPKALYQFNNDLVVNTLDIRDDSRASEKGNYLEKDLKGKYDVIITNPPFNISKDIILKAIDDVKEGGYVIMLLRLNYFGGKVREDLWKNFMPKYCFVHNKRISFTSDKKTDSIEYCHLVWKKGENPDFTKLRVLLEQ